MIGDKIITLDDTHPLVVYIKQYNWKEIVNYGDVTVSLREGRPTLITVKTTLKLD